MSRFIGAFQQYLLNIVPWYLRDKHVGSFLESLGVALDSTITSLQTGLALGQPLLCDSSALPTLATNRRIRLYSSESEASQRDRLSKWLLLHAQRGTHRGELNHVQPYFLPAKPVMRIVHQSGDGATATWHKIDAAGVYSVEHVSPSNWNYDTRTAEWSRFWCILYAPAGLRTLTYWDYGSKWDDGSKWGGLTTQVAVDLLAMITEWQSAHSALQAFIVTEDSTLFDPASSWGDGTWGSPLTPAGTITRPIGAEWIYERGML